MSVDTPKVLTLALFTGIDPNATTHVDVSIKGLNVCSRHQLTITVTPDPPSAGTVKVRGISYNSGLAPAHIDSRLDAISLTTLGSQMFIFYGMFDALRFDMASFPTGCKLSAAIASHQDSLTIGSSSP